MAYDPEQDHSDPEFEAVETEVTEQEQSEEGSDQEASEDAPEAAQEAATEQAAAPAVQVADSAAVAAGPAPAALPEPSAAGGAPTQAELEALREHFNNRNRESPSRAEVPVALRPCPQGPQ